MDESIYLCLIKGIVIMVYLSVPPGFSHHFSLSTSISYTHRLRVSLEEDRVIRSNLVVPTHETLFKPFREANLALQASLEEKEEELKVWIDG